MGNENLERLLDLIADSLVQSRYVDTETVSSNQKVIRDGIIQPAGTNVGIDERIILYQKDVEANIADLQQGIAGDTDNIISKLQIIANQVDFSSISIDIRKQNNLGELPDNPTLDNRVGQIAIILRDNFTYIRGENITEFIASDGDFSNTSQFIPIQQVSSVVDSEQAEEFLDTNIFELLPTGDTRQARIIRFFQEMDALLPETLPNFGVNDDGRVDRDNFDDWSGGEQYSLNNSISAAQNYPEDSNIEEENAFLHRLTSDSINNDSSIANPNSTNEARTIEDIYNRVVPYLADILEEPLTLADERPTYQNKSNGYLQFRNLNQGIIIRNTNQEFVQGLNPQTQDYLQTGFTITMWVKFLDKTSTGTLFNFGNPTRDENPFGFKLETYVINSDDVPRNSRGEFIEGFEQTDEATWGQMFLDGNPLGMEFDNQPPDEGFFKQNDTERFIRLVVQDGDRLRGSHMGMPFMNRRAGLPEFPELSGGYDYYTYELNNNPGDEAISSPYDHCYGLMTNTRVPVNLNEWYFICASFNPSVEEEESHTDSTIYDEFKNNSNFWKNNITVGNEFVPQSDLGAKSKVEIISRTDLLRARGFKI